MSETKKIVFFGIFDAIYWGIMGTFGSYLVAFALNNKGFSQSVVSIMLSIYLIGGFIGQFFWGTVCDRYKTNKKVFMIGVLSAGICQLILYFTNSLLLFSIVYLLFGFSLGPMGSILDTWMLKALNNDMKKYGVSRGFGSIGYAIIAYLMGNAIKRFGYHLMPYVSTVFVLITLTIAFLTRDVQYHHSANRISATDIIPLFKNKAFASLLLILFLKSLAGSPVNNFKITMFQAVGGDVDTQGLDALLGCIVQFVFFEITGILAKISYQKRISLSVLAMLAATYLYFIADNSALIILGSLFVNATYGMMMPAIREAVIDIIEPQYHTTAISICDAMYSFLGGIVSMTYAGTVSQLYGLKVMIMISLTLFVVTLVVSLLTFRRNDKVFCPQQIDSCNM